MHVDGTEDLLLGVAALRGRRRARGADAGGRRARWPTRRAPRCSRDLVGERANRRHRPGRGFEALRYRFEIVSDYGAFRDLQRHRMLTVQWQGLTPDLGAEIPEEVVAAGCGDEYERALDVSRAEYERLRDAGRAEAAPYALCLGYRIRYVLDLNAREAMHLTELRSAREGHASYRAVAQAMHTAIAARPPRRRRGDEARRPLVRAAPRAHPGRDPRRVPPRPAHRVSVRDEILAAAERRSRALVARDADALRALHHPDLRFTTHRGDVRDRDAYIRGNTEGDLVWRDQRLTDVDVVAVGDTAVLTALVHDEFERAGEPGAHNMRLTLAWVREDGTWRVLAGHAGPAG